MPAEIKKTMRHSTGSFSFFTTKPTNSGATIDITLAPAFVNPINVPAKFGAMSIWFTWFRWAKKANKKKKLRFIEMEKSIYGIQSNFICSFVEREKKNTHKTSNSLLFSCSMYSLESLSMSPNWYRPQWQAGILPNLFRRLSHSQVQRAHTLESNDLNTKETDYLGLFCSALLQIFFFSLGWNSCSLFLASTFFFITCRWWWWKQN